jgi:sugar-specific transcriptional regulator TrmB
MSESQQCLDALEGLGFTGLEATIYVCLLRTSPATGYRVAKEMGRTFSTTYRVLESLERKGAVVLDDGETKLYRAVPTTDLVRQMKSKLVECGAQLVEASRELPTSELDDRIYRLKTPGQVFEKARVLLQESRERVLMEISPEPLEELRSVIEETGARGVDVTARLYSPGTISNVRCVQSQHGRELHGYRRPEWLALFIDGMQFLIGYLPIREGQDVRAVWSASLFLSEAFFAYVNSDLHHYAFVPRFMEAGSLDEARKDYARLREEMPPGADIRCRLKLERFGVK